MVCIKTAQPDIRFTHFVDVIDSKCLIGTARDRDNRIKLYLIKPDTRQLFYRSGRTGVWIEVDNPSDHRALSKLISSAGKHLPQYTVDRVDGILSSN